MPQKTKKTTASNSPNVKPIKQMSDIDDNYLHVVKATVQNIGLESAFEHAGPTANAYRIAYTAVELLMDGLGDEVKAENYFMKELNHIIARHKK